MEEVPFHAQNFFCPIDEQECRQKISRQSDESDDKIRKISAHRAAIILHQTVGKCEKRRVPFIERYKGDREVDPGQYRKDTNYCAYLAVLVVPAFAARRGLPPAAGRLIG